MILPSGAELKITVAAFDLANDLLQAFSKEAKNLVIDEFDELDVNFYKNIICAAIASKEIGDCLWACIDGRVLYNGKHLTKAIFEPEEARQDYLEVMAEVAKANLLPFVKSLYAKYSQTLEQLRSRPA